MSHSKHVWGALLAASLAAGGCVGGAAGVSSEQLLVGDGELGAIERESWEDAEAGCDGLVTADVRFAIASAEFGLVAVLESDGDVRCVDTVESVEEELQEAGRIEEAHQLVVAFQASMHERDSPMMAFTGRAGDPDPEPNRGFSRMMRSGDPDPEPNRAP